MTYIIQEGWTMYWGTSRWTHCEVIYTRIQPLSVCVCVHEANLSKFFFPSLCVNFIQIMEAYSNCRQFNCVPPIVEQSEYHMFCREKCELYLPEMYNKIGVGLCAWGPLSMALGDAQNGERLLFPKNSFKTKSHSYSWTEDEINKNVSELRITRTMAM